MLCALCRLYVVLKNIDRPILNPNPNPRRLLLTLTLALTRTITLASSPVTLTWAAPRRFLLNKFNPT